MMFVVNEFRWSYHADWINMLRDVANTAPAQLAAMVPKCFLDIWQLTDETWKFALGQPVGVFAIVARRSDFTLPCNPNAWERFVVTFV
jgi:hypothetical protein